MDAHAAPPRTGASESVFGVEQSFRQLEIFNGLTRFTLNPNDHLQE